MKARRPQGPIRISAATRAIIRKESKALGLSEQEYVQLLSQLAQAIRGSVLPDGTSDASTLRALIANPLLLSVAAAMAGTVWNSVKDQLESTETDDSNTPTDRDAALAPGTPTRRPSPHGYPYPPGPTYRVPYGYPPYPLPARPQAPLASVPGAAQANRPAQGRVQSASPPYPPYAAQWQGSRG